MIISFFTSCAFLIPAYVAMVAGNKEGAMIMFASSVASMIYHVDEHDMMHFVFDYLCVILIKAFVLPLYFDKHTKITYLNLLAHTLLAAAFYFWMFAPDCPSKEDCECNVEQSFVREADCFRYDWMHSCWHVCISICLSCFILSNMLVSRHAQSLLVKEILFPINFIFKYLN